MVSIHGPLGYGPSTLPLRHSAVCLRGAFQMCILLASHIRVEVIEFPAYGWCNRCAIQYLQSRLSPMHLDAKLSLQHPKNKENSFGHRKLKFCAYSMLLVTNNTKIVWCSKTTNSKKYPPRRGIEPRSPAWQAGILTTILPRTHLRAVVTESNIYG